MPPTQPPALRMADRLVPGGLTDELRRYRAAGVSWAAVCRLLGTQYGIDVSESTLRSWAKQLGLDVSARPIDEKANGKRAAS